VKRNSPAVSLAAGLSGLLILLASIAASATTLAELEQADRLRVKTWLEPADGIIARQQLKLQIEVATDKWFGGGTRIGHFEIKDAIVLQRENFALNSTRSEGDKDWTVQQWTLVVYPQRSGTFEIPPIPLTMTVVGDDLKPIQGLLQSKPFDFTAGQPEATQGTDEWVATSRFEVDEQFDKSLEELGPGDAVQRTITISADNLPAMMLPQVQATRIDGIAIYSKPAQLHDKVNRGEYIAERTQRITYVFEKPGEYQLPSETFYWWNLETETLETATLAARDLQVAGLPGQSTAQSEVTGAEFSDRLRSLLPTLYVVAGVVIILLAVLWLVRKRTASAAAKEDSAQVSTPTESQLLKQAKTACRQHDDEKAVGYLYQWMSYYGNNRNGAIGTRVEELGDDTLSQTYKTVMQAIYARDKSASTDTCRFIDQLIDAIRHRDKPRHPLRRSVEIKLN
jgi:hypothetical protein